MTRAQKITLGFLSAITCSLLLVVLYTASQAVQAWRQQPLGPTLAYPTEWQLPATWTASPGGSQPTITLAPALTFETETPASPFLTCNDLPTMTVLAIGTDVRSGKHRYGLSDVMRAVRVDFREQRVTALEFPRDLWVKIPEIERNLKRTIKSSTPPMPMASPNMGQDFWRALST